jgi:hypothetical protein
MRATRQPAGKPEKAHQPLRRQGEKAMKTIKIAGGALIAAAALCGSIVSTSAAADNLPLNTVIGAGAGALLGNSFGGRNGALVGGLLGAAAGVAISSQRQAVAYGPPVYQQQGYAQQGYAQQQYEYAAPPVYAPPAYAQPAPVYVQAPVYAPAPMYAPAPIYVAPRQVGYYGYGHHERHGWEHRHWR